ncbi:MAG: pyridoxal phosphate-dependent aminotransferase [Phycisphaerales bacterium JB039]
MTQTDSSPARYPFAIIRERMRRCDDLLDFAFGSQRPSPPAHVVERIRREPERIVRRAGPALLEALRAQAAAMLQREYGVEVDPDAILPVPSGRAAIAGLAATTLRAGDRIVVIEPVYPTIGHVAAGLGAQVEPVWLRAEAGFLPEMEMLAPALRGARMCALSFPNNPTGAVLPESMTAPALGAMPGGVLFNDATYGPMTYHEPPRSLLAGLDSGGPPVVELHILSKLYGLEGIGVAFIAGAREVIEPLRIYAEYACTPVSELQAHVAIDCLADETALGQLRETYAMRMRRLGETLTQLGLHPYPAASGLYILCPSPRQVAGRPAPSAWEAAHMLLDAFSLATMPWAGPDGGWLRFSAMHTDADLERLAGLDLIHR